MLTLEAQLNKGEKIYIRNLTNPRGVIFLTLWDHGSRPIKVVIPQTPHPFCLSDRVTPYSLNEGGQMLREILNKGAIKLVSQKRAENELSDPEVREQLKRAVSATEAINDEVRKFRNTRDKKDSDIKVVKEAEDQGEVSTNIPDKIKVIREDDDDSGAPGVSSPVRILVSQILSNDISSKDAKAKISDVADQLSMTDLAYLNDHTSGQVREYVLLLINQNAGNAAADDEEEDDEDESDAATQARFTPRSNATPGGTTEGPGVSEYDGSRFADNKTASGKSNDDDISEDDDNSKKSKPSTPSKK